MNNSGLLKGGELPKQEMRMEERAGQNIVGGHDDSTTKSTIVPSHFV
jgi:hypothetical protein